MTDKLLNERLLLNASGNPCCLDFNKYFFNNSRILTQKSFLCFQICCSCSEMVTMVATKVSQPCFKCVKLFIHKIFTLYNVCSVNWGIFSKSGDVQYMGGTMSTLGHVQYIRGYHDECGGYHVYIGGCLSTSGWNIISTLTDVQYIRGIS